LGKFLERVTVDDDVLEHMEAVCDEGKRPNSIPCEVLGLCESMIKGYEPTMSSTKKKRTSMTRRIIILAERDRPMAALKKERKKRCNFVLIGLRPLGDRLPVVQKMVSEIKTSVCLCESAQSSQMYGLPKSLNKTGYFAKKVLDGFLWK